ncbi:hypothetical protein [Pseudomonas sp. WS 5027]|uniref:hypothetical protein n=1 Tax=Pseudomonas sp. WS 5027 TaxID=2717483 RepID=UPI001472E45F|nr:hypothetical protein [Pseudomonas sp. WS 5027]NMY49119.1 hypothetical protein [Pseudomonas sp. WS 5027]
MTDNARVIRFTAAGLNELVLAKNRGLKGEITHVAAGTGRYNPTGAETALQAETQRVAVNDYEDLGGGNLRIAALFDGPLEYEVGEFGFFLSTGTLLGVYSQADVLQTYKAASARILQRFTLNLSALPTDSVTVVIGGESLNLLLTEELAQLATANVDNMARHVGLLLRVLELEGK